MQTNAYKTSVAVVPLLICSSMMMAFAQTGTQADKAASAQSVKKASQRIHQDISKVNGPAAAIEPHHVLAMAFMQNIETFTRVLSDQALGGSPLSSDFARAAVAEISRNFDEAQTHHREHVKTLTPGVSTYSGDIDVHDSKLKEAIETLEKEVRNYTLNSTRIATDCAGVLKRLDEMAKIHLHD